MSNDRISHSALLDRLWQLTVAAWGAYATRAGGRIVEESGVAYVIGSHPSPVIINTAFRVDRGVAPEHVLRRSRERYSSLGHGFTLVTSDHADADLIAAARAAAWTLALEVPAMVCRSRLGDRVFDPAGRSGSRHRWVPRHCT